MNTDSFTVSGKILVIDDEKFITKSLKQHLQKDGHEVLTADNGEQGLEEYRENAPDITILDLNMPGIGGIEVLQEIKSCNKDAVVIVVTAYTDIETAVSTIKSGAYDFVEKPFELDRISILIRKALESIRLKREVTYLREEKYNRYKFSNIVGRSEALKEVLDVAKKLAKSDVSPILIQGESGTGKGIIARTIHYQGPRASESFVEVSCTDRSESLMENELFGYEKDAFADAKSAKKGLFELVGRGTIFIDHIADMKKSTQAKVLRALEDKSFRRIGGVADIRFNVKIIATTDNAKLEKALAAGSFREDLYYNLKVCPIMIPPLRERRDDIIPLALYYMGVFNTEFKKNVTSISEEAQAILTAYDWPGNIRELKNVIERIFILEDTEVITPELLPKSLAG
ncbi:MAG: sigma-54-dependent Fis family transcriptional regulator [Nitrospira sp.]|nr:sigma-54-dependent Fis family transcriptional regulator [Nitrospira sp.]